MAAVCQQRRALVEIPAPQPKIAGKLTVWSYGGGGGGGVKASWWWWWWWEGGVQHHHLNGVGRVGPSATFMEVVHSWQWG